jgi:hypothetical protein
MNHRPELISRRGLLRLTLISPLAAAIFPSIRRAQTELVDRLDRQVFLRAPFRIIPSDDTAQIDRLKLIREWNGAFCRSSLTNAGNKSARIKEIILFDVPNSLPGETRLYGEGFQMLSQTLGRSRHPLISAHTPM